MDIPIMYNIRSMWQRRLSTTLTIGGIALVVFIFSAVLMLANGLEQTLVATGSDDNAIVVRKSASSEVMSSVSREAANIIKTFPDIAVSGETPLITTEVVSIINLNKKETDEIGNVTVRGVSLEALSIRPQVKIFQGSMFQAGSTDIVVGKAIADRFKGCEPGNSLTFGGQKWNIVGIFKSEGAGFESEIWSDITQLMSAFNRNYFSSVTFRMKNPAALKAVNERMENYPQLKQMEAKAEKKYYEEQSAFMSAFIRTLGLMITIVFSIAAVIGAMITMYSAVANRTRAIGTLRVLGFRRSNILFSFLMEAILLSLLGGLIGLGLASLLQFYTISTLNFGSFSETAFGFHLSVNIIVSSLLFTLFMGIIGGFLPAVRASRLAIVKALRA